MADAALDLYEAAKPAPPKEILVTGADDRMTLDSAWFRPPLHFATANGLCQTVPAEGWRAMLRNPPRMFGSDEVNKRALERIRVGLAAAERYEDAIRKVDVETGYSAANKAFEDAHDRLWEIDDQIVAMKARSINDLIQQANVVRAHCESGVSDCMINALLTSIEALGSRAER